MKAVHFASTMYTMHITKIFLCKRGAYCQQIFRVHCLLEKTDVSDYRILNEIYDLIGLSSSELRE